MKQYFYLLLTILLIQQPRITSSDLVTPNYPSSDSSYQPTFIQDLSTPPGDSSHQNLTRNLDIQPKLYIRLQNSSYFNKKLLLTIQSFCIISNGFECLRISSSDPNYVADQIITPIRLEFTNSAIDASLEYSGQFSGPFTLDISYLTPGGFLKEVYNNQDFQGQPDFSTLFSNLSFNDEVGVCSASFIGYFLGPKSGTVTFYIKHDDTIKVWLSDYLCMDSVYYGYQYRVFYFTFTEGNVYYSKVNLVNTDYGFFGQSFEWDASGSITNIPTSNQLYPTRIPGMPHNLSSLLCDTHCNDNDNMFKCYLAGVQLCNACDANISYSICTGCKGRSYLEQGVCKCPAGYYLANSNQDDCAACDRLCEECQEIDGRQRCTQCKSNASYSTTDEKCVCNEGFYLESPGSCSVCFEKCTRCVDNVCQSCESGYFLTAIDTIACKPCTNLCTQCTCTNCHSQSTPTCTSCISNASVVSGQCTCNEGYYTNGNSCEGCISNCKRCENDATCDQCKAGYYKDLNSPIICLQCTGLCHECEKDSSGIIKCLSCSFNTSLVSGECICNAGFYLSAPSTCSTCFENCSTCSNNICQECLAGYYKPISSSNTCLKCNGPCYECQEVSEGNISCLSCILNASLSSGECLCNSGYYLSASNTCLACPDLCYECTAGSDGSIACSNCKPNSSLASGQCTCNQGFYLAGSTCSGCMSNCKRCLNSSSCEECDSGYYIDSSNSNTCLACTGLCLECEKDPSGIVRCLSCKPNAKIASGECVCNGGYYKSKSGSCLACTGLCLECEEGSNGNVNCLACKSNASLSSGQCTCNQGFYFANESECSACASNCKRCSSNISCDECITGYYLDSSSSSICMACSVLCNECVKEASGSLICLSCKPNSSLISGQCLCNDGYYISSSSANICSSCISNCKKCSSSSSCDLCHPDYTYKASPSPVCDMSCLSNYYRNSDNICMICPQGCATCDNASMCNSCTSSYYLYSSGSTKECLSSCPFFFYGDSSMTCKACSSNCKICNSPSSCTTCGDGYYKNSNGSCTVCPKQCETCGVVSGQVRCTYCAKNNYMNSNTCSTTCPSGRFPIESNRSCGECQSGKFKAPRGCINCPALCKECLNANTCTFCIDNASLNSDKMCLCNENYEVKSGLCQRKQVTYTIEYSNLSRVIDLELSAELTTPLTKNDITVKIGSTVLTPDLYNLIQRSDKKGYTILLSDYIIGAARLSITITGQGFSDFQGNSLDDTEKTLILIEPDEESEDSIQDSDGESDKEEIETIMQVGYIIYPGMCGVITVISLLFSPELYISNHVSSMLTISYFYLIDLKWTDFTLKLLSSLLYYNRIPNILNIIPTEGEGMSKNFRDLGYDTPQFIRNSGSILPIFAAMILIYLIVYLVKCLFNKSEKISRLYYTLGWRLIVKFYIETYQIISLLSLLQIYYYDFSSFYLILDFISACIFMVLFNQIPILLGPILLLALFYYHRHNLDDREFLYRWGFLYKHVKYSQYAYCSFLYPLLLLRKLLFSINFILLHNHAVAQIILCIILSSTSLLFGLYFRPFQSRFQNAFNIISEAIMTSISALLFGFIHRNEIIEWVIVISILTGFIANIILLISQSITNLLSNRNLNNKPAEPARRKNLAILGSGMIDTSSAIEDSSKTEISMFRTYIEIETSRELKNIKKLNHTN